MNSFKLPAILAIALLNGCANDTHSEAVESIETRAAEVT